MHVARQRRRFSLILEGSSMTAPALVMVSRGSADSRVTQVTHTMRRGLQDMRPELSISGAFLDHCSPSGSQVVAQLVKQKTEEIVFVPLDLTNAVSPDPLVEALLMRCRATHPGTRFTVSRPIGPEASLLTILDQRLRSALCEARILELDGLVLSSASCGDVRGSALLARRARQWSTHHRLPCLTAAADGSGPSVAQAIASLRAQGRRHIAVGSFFLTADDLFHQQSELASRCGALAVSEPLGPDPEVLDLVLTRYSFAAMDLLDFGMDSEEPPSRHLAVVGA